MMKSTLLAVLVIPVLLGGDPASAASCKFAENTADLFAGVTIVRTKWDRISPNWEKTKEKYIGYVSASSEGEDTFLTVRIRYLEQARFKPSKDELANALVVPEGTDLLIIMSDKTSIALPAAESVAAENEIYSPYSREYGGDDYIVISKAEGKYAVDQAAAEALAAQDATIMRMITSTGHHDIPLHKNSLSGIRNAINCLSSVPE